MAYGPTVVDELDLHHHRLTIEAEQSDNYIPSPSEPPSGANDDAAPPNSDKI